MYNLLFLFSFLLSVFYGTVSYAENFRDKKTYNISDEISYSILMYDNYNSLILNFLDQAGQSPDQAGAIEAIRQTDPDRVMDVELRAALVFVHMNLPLVKKKTIAAFQENDIHVLTGNYDLKRLDASSVYLYQKIDDSMKSLMKKQLTLESALISYWLLNPPIDFSHIRPDLPVTLMNSAVQIAKSRFNLKKWHDKIETCVVETQKAEGGSFSAERIMMCGHDYVTAVSAEAAHVVIELLPYYAFFAGSRLIGSEEMVKEELGDTWLWRKKEK